MLQNREDTVSNDQVSDCNSVLVFSSIVVDWQLNLNLRFLLLASIGLGSSLHL
ncbi:hypothetical protein LOK49_Contig407G00002 [Camellia lanceoleosa]|nr:hypothetical protein LOK49_Contig407G00002 [Camellia lanceoleosa]